MTRLHPCLRPLVVLAVLSLVGAGAHAAPARKKPSKKPAAAAKAPTVSGEIELVHEMGSDKGAELSKIVERFNATNPGATVRIVERKWDEGEIPALMILADDSEARLLAGKPRYRPLNAVMKEAREPLQSVRAPATMSPTPLDARGNLVALPIDLGTPIMYINRDAFRAAGLDPDAPPATWFGLQTALGQLYDKGYGCPYTTSQPGWVHVENTSAWHNQAVAATSGKREVLAVNNLLQVKHLAMMKSWVTSRYMHVFGDGLDAEAQFAAGNCAVLTGSSNAFPSLKRTAKFEVGVAPLPHHDDIPGSPQNTLADGPAMWVGAGQSASQYRIAARFVSYLLSPQTQVELQVNLGSLPLNRAGLLASGSELLSSDLLNIRTALAQLNYKPSTSASRATRLTHDGTVRRVLNEELGNLWSDRKPAKGALDSAVIRLNGCCAR